MPPPPRLANNCAGCSYSRVLPPTALLCVRHGPSPTSEPSHVSQTFEVVEWPRVRPRDRCGAGADRAAANAPVVVSCESCLHWLQPGGIGIVPDVRGRHPAEWWAASGYCTRFAPSPSVEPEDMHAHWRCTHAHDGCGDGQAIEQDEEADAGDLTPAAQPVAALAASD